MDNTTRCEKDHDPIQHNSKEGCPVCRKERELHVTINRLSDYKLHITELKRDIFSLVRTYSRILDTYIQIRRDNDSL